MTCVMGANRFSDEIEYSEPGAWPKRKTMDPIDIFRSLRDAHGQVLRGLDSLAQATARNWSRDGVETLNEMVGRLQCECLSHVHAEEQVLFPALLEALEDTRDILQLLQVEHEELLAMLAA